jgi:hypothetical protein
VEERKEKKRKGKKRKEKKRNIQERYFTQDVTRNHTTSNLGEKC